MVVETVWSLDEESCKVCKKRTTRKCSVCQDMFYCSKEHQKEHWADHKKTCTPIMKIENDPIFGEQWVAAKHLDAETLLFTEIPVLKSVSWPSDSHKDSHKSKAICLACGTKIQLLSECGGYAWGCYCEECSWPVCSETCAKNPVHAENECKLFKASGFEFPPNVTDVTPSRINLAVDIARAITLKRFSEKKFLKLLNLQKRPSIDLPAEKIAYEKESVEVMKKYFDYASSGLTDDDVLALQWTRKLNAFRFDKSEDKSGIYCTYIKASKFSNGCTPNCYISIQPQGPIFKIQVQTANEVMNGEALTIAYSSDKPFEGTLERQKKLRRVHHFVCQCKRCMDPTELGSYISAVTCPNCYEKLKSENWLIERNDGFLLPKDPLSTEDDAVWECNRCSNSVTASSVWPKIVEIQKSLEETKSDDVMVYNGILEGSMGKVLHQCHYVNLQIIQEMLRCLNIMEKSGRRYNSDKTHVLHLKHLLQIHDIIHPGYAYWRSLRQFELVSFLQSAVTKTMDDELSADIQVTAGYLKGALKFFEKYKDEVPEGAKRYRALRDIKYYYKSKEFI